MCDFGTTDSLETECNTISMTATKYSICIKIPQITAWTNVLQSEPVSKYVLMAKANRTMRRPRKKSKKDIAVQLAAARITRLWPSSSQRVNHHNTSETGQSGKILGSA